MRTVTPVLLIPTLLTLALTANRGETADHAKSDPSPHGKMTRSEEAAAMPLPGQANDHSSLALDAKK